jgi:hypothetical protein
MMPNQLLRRRQVIIRMLRAQTNFYPVSEGKLS